MSRPSLPTFIPIRGKPDPLSTWKWFGGWPPRGSTGGGKGEQGVTSFDEEAHRDALRELEKTLGASITR